VSTDFDGNGGVGKILTEFFECGAVVGNDAFLKNGTVSIGDASMVFFVTEIDADVFCEWLVCVFCFCFHKDGEVVWWSVLAASSPSHSI